MYKVSKIFIIFCLLLSFYCVTSFAVEVDMNTINNQLYNNTTNNTENTSNTQVSTNTTTNTNSQTTNTISTITPSTQTRVSVSELPEANLGLTNILNIILIVVGALLILLSIAILIRLKGNK